MHPEKLIVHPRHPGSQLPQAGLKMIPDSLILNKPVLLARPIILNLVPSPIQNQARPVEILVVGQLKLGQVEG